jgi:Family of unknown function (DUF5996)
MSSSSKIVRNPWPALPHAEWKDTYRTLHMWAQIVGKVRLALTPLVNHWWEVPLYVNSLGLTTSAIPFEGGVFEVQFDFLHHQLAIQSSDGQSHVLPLAARSVADFYREFMAALHALGIVVKIWPVPVEISDPIPFERDTQPGAYDPEYVQRFWQILISVHHVFLEFRARFIGKASPVHFFWGSFDFAATRFSGRTAPVREDADRITREAYSHEVISAGFWPGSGEVRDPAFYVYAAPEPSGFATHPVRPRQAFYHPQMKEFLLMYEDVRRSSSPAEALMQFLQTTYEAGADLAKWDRKSLDRTA